MTIIVAAGDVFLYVLSNLPLCHHVVQHCGFCLCQFSCGPLRFAIVSSLRDALMLSCLTIQAFYTPYFVAHCICAVLRGSHLILSAVTEIPVVFFLFDHSAAIIRRTFHLSILILSNLPVVPRPALPDPFCHSAAVLMHTCFLLCSIGFSYNTGVRQHVHAARVRFHLHMGVCHLRTFMGKLLLCSFVCCAVLSSLGLFVCVCCRCLCFLLFGCVVCL